MSIEQIVDVPANGKLTIQLPSSLKDRKRVKLIINDIEDTLENKISLLKAACNDKDFLTDMQEVNKDFELVESNNQFTNC
jgi:plasmid maintenance system killer protein